VGAGTRAPLLFAFALLASACSGHDGNGETLPRAIQDELPLEVSLGNLCPGAESPPHVLREVERKAEALIRELRIHPDAVVTYMQPIEGEGPTPEQMTVREVAKIELDGLRDPDGGYCHPELAGRIEEALG
jgi:hypothetical protein